MFHASLRASRAMICSTIATASREVGAVRSARLNFPACPASTNASTPLTTSAPRMLSAIRRRKAERRRSRPSGSMEPAATRESSTDKTVSLLNWRMRSTRAVRRAGRALRRVRCSAGHAGGGVCVALVERLMIQQRHGQSLELFAVGADQRGNVLVGGVDQLTHLLVDHLLG